MFGASFSAAGGIYKNLGYAPAGYDGVDNDGNGAIDDFTEASIGLTPAQVDPTSVKYNKLAQCPHPQDRPSGDALRHPGRRARAAWQRLQPRRLHRQGGPGHRRRRPARVRRRLGRAAPVLPLADLPRRPIANGINLGTSDSQLGCAGYNSAGAGPPARPARPEPVARLGRLVVGGANASLTTPAQASFTATERRDSGGQSERDRIHDVLPFARRSHCGGGNRLGSERELESARVLLQVPGRLGRPRPEPGHCSQDYSAGILRARSPFPGTIQHERLVADLHREPGRSERSLTVRPWRPVLRGSRHKFAHDCLSLRLHAVLDDITNHNISGPSTGVR